MKIAILVWGSLFWDPQGLSTTGEWFNDGPLLPIEFARISGGNRITLVIKPNCENVTVLYTISLYDDLDRAIQNLKTRENTPNTNNIGFVDYTNNRCNLREANKFILESLEKWNAEKKFDAIIWSDFAPKFSDVIKKPLTIQNVIEFINDLSEKEQQGAIKYIQNTPAQIRTNFRSSLEKYFKLQ